jgi:hypothetical protein
MEAMQIQVEFAAIEPPVRCREVAKDIYLLAPVRFATPSLLSFRAGRLFALSAKLRRQASTLVLFILFASFLRSKFIELLSNIRQALSTTSGAMAMAAQQSSNERAARWHSNRIATFLMAATIAATSSGWWIQPAEGEAFRCTVARSMSDR